VSLLENELPGDNGVYSKVTLNFFPIDAVIDWKRCGIIANFISDYFRLHFDNEDAPHFSLSTIINEVIENVNRYSYEKNREARLTVSHLGDYIVIETVHTASKEQAKRLNQTMKKLGISNIETLFFSQVESAIDNELTESGLGLISLKKDYDAVVSANISPTTDEEVYSVGIQIKIDTRKLLPMHA